MASLGNTRLTAMPRLLRVWLANVWPMNSTMPASQASPNSENSTTALASVGRKVLPSSPAVSSRSVSSAICATSRTGSTGW